MNLFLCSLFLLLGLVHPGYADTSTPITPAIASDVAGQRSSVPSPDAILPDVHDYSLTPDSIMRLTMDNNVKIEAAKHQLESAEYNFKLFESRYTQFTPFEMNSGILRNREDEFKGETSVGIEKEYFGGSSISADIATRNIWGDDEPDESAQFLRTRVQFPLFSSNRKLTRIIERTFEENELYSAQLDYVDTIRDTIKNALEQYYDYIPRSQTLERLGVYREGLVQLRDCAPLSGRPIDRQQLDGEINSLTSRIQGWDNMVQSLLIEMEQWIGVDNFERYAIDLIELDFDRDDFFGEFYVAAPSHEILKQTLDNDTELMVLELIKINAIEKKRLAQKGKWDIFLSFEGKYGFNEEVGVEEQDEYYEVYSDLVVRKFDKSVLLNTIRKSDADILYIERTMEDRQNELAAGISQKKVSLLTTKDQVVSSRKGLDSWKAIHDLKKKEFINGAETADNYLQAFRSLVDAMQRELRYENEYLDTIRDFDYICGKYFSLLDTSQSGTFQIGD